MWSTFEAKCVKVVSFSIIQDFASSNVDALSQFHQFGPEILLSVLLGFGADLYSLFSHPPICCFSPNMWAVLAGCLYSMIIAIDWLLWVSARVILVSRKLPLIITGVQFAWPFFICIVLLMLIHYNQIIYQLVVVNTQYSFWLVGCV